MQNISERIRQIFLEYGFDFRLSTAFDRYVWRKHTHQFGNGGRNQLPALKSMRAEKGPEMAEHYERGIQLLQKQNLLWLL